MKIQLESGTQNLISHYGPGSISINGTEYSQNILITASRVVENWFEGDLVTLSLAHFEPLFDGSQGCEKPEIVLLGTGQNHTFPDMKLLAELKAHDIALEVMNTRAACRTYSVLINEDRPVAAAMLQIEE